MQAFRPTMMVLALIGLLAFLAAGCGSGDDGGSAADQLAQQQQIQQARRDAAQQQRTQDKLKQLQQQLKEQKKGSSAQATTTTPAPTTTTSSSSGSGGSTSCGGDLSVGPSTSCSFAANVRSAYEKSGGGNVLIKAFSPVTNTTYEMACGSTGSTVVCTGGNNASVFFP
jgi:Flp pilus assembly protein TadG